MQTTSTPLVFRGPDSRRSYEEELWHETANNVYTTTGVSLVVPVRPTQARMEIHCQGRLAGAGTMTASLDGNPLAPTGITVAAETTNITTFADVFAGNHTITLAATAGLTETIILVRLGRKPPL